MRKIAIIKTREYYNDYSSETIVESITDWEEVDEETFNTLQDAQYKYNFTVIEQPINPKEFILKTISDYKEMVVKEEKKRKVDEEKRKKAKELSTKENLKKRLEKAERDRIKIEAQLAEMKD